MTDQPDRAPDEYSIPENIGEIRLFPRPVVWAAGMVILALAVIGMAQGIRGAITGGGAGSGPEELTTGDAVSAQAAQPLSGNPSFTVLSGAAMASSSAASAAQAARSSSSDQSDENQNSAQTQAESAVAPPPPAPANAQPATAAPAPQSSGQADTMPPT